MLVSYSLKSTKSSLVLLLFRNNSVHSSCFTHPRDESHHSSLMTLQSWWCVHSPDESWCYDGRGGMGATLRPSYPMLENPLISREKIPTANSFQEQKHNPKPCAMHTGELQLLWQIDNNGQNQPRKYSHCSEQNWRTGFTSLTHIHTHLVLFNQTTPFPKGIKKANCGPPKN